MPRPFALVARTGFGFAVFLPDPAAAPCFCSVNDGTGPHFLSPASYLDFVDDHGRTHCLISLHELPLCCVGCIPISVCFSAAAASTVPELLDGVTEFFGHFLHFWTPVHSSLARQSAIRMMAHLSSHPTSAFYASA